MNANSPTEKVTAAAKYKEATRLVQQKNFAAALTLFEDLASSYPGDKDILYGRALCLHSLGRSSEAKPLCDRLAAEHKDPRAQKLSRAIAAAGQPAAKPGPKSAKTPRESDWSGRRRQRLSGLARNRSGGEASLRALISADADDPQARENEQRGIASYAGRLRQEWPALERALTGRAELDGGTESCRRAAERLLEEEDAASDLTGCWRLIPYLANPYRWLALPAGGAEGAPALDGLAGVAPTIACGYGPDYATLPDSDLYSDPEAWLVAELFWPHAHQTYFQPAIDERSLASLDVILNYTTRASRDKPLTRVLGIHGLAVLYHNLAVAGECLRANGWHGAVDLYWDAALAMWRRTIDSELFWRYILKRATELGASTVTPNNVSTYRVGLSRKLVTINERFSEMYADAGMDHAAFRHLAYIEKSGLADSVVDPVLTAAVQAIYW